MLFVGKGRYRLTPASEAERYQVSMASGDERLEVLEEHFEKLVLLFMDDTFAEISRGSTVAVGAADFGASQILQGFRKTLKKKFSINLNHRILEAFLNSQKAEDGFFLALMDGKQLPLAVASVDPNGISAPRLTPNIRLGPGKSCLFVADKSKGGFWYLSHLLRELQTGR